MRRRCWHRQRISIPSPYFTNRSFWCTVFSRTPWPMTSGMSDSTPRLMLELPLESQDSIQLFCNVLHSPNTAHLIKTSPMIRRLKFKRMQRKGTSHTSSWNRAPRQVRNSERIWVTTAQLGRTNIPRVVKQLSIIWRIIAIVLCVHQLQKKAVCLHKVRAMATPILLTKNIGKTRIATSVGIKDTLYHIEKPSWAATERRRIMITTVVRCPENQDHIP